MKKVIIILICLTGVLLNTSLLFAVEVAPRITDREIVERLTRLEEGQKNIEKRFEDVNRRFDDVNKRFDLLQWMFGLFITINIVILGFVLRMQWQMQKKQAIMEATLETQKEELAFIRRLVEKVFPPKGVL